MNARMSGLRRRIWEARYLYLLLLPLVAFLIFFRYIPMLGLQIAFKKYSAKLGIWGSKWIGLDNFRRIFISPDAIRAIRNTIIISLSRLVFEFPIPIALALLINEMPGRKLKRVYQTVLTFPHFLSWVIVGSIVKNLLSVDGVVNGLMAGMGLEKVSFLGNKDLFRPLIYISEIWKEAGWSSIIYLAAISGIDPQLYEVAEIDGASRFQRVVNITLPSIFPTIAVMLILQMGGIMGGHFDQIYNLQNDVIASSAETLNLYIYRITFQRTPNYGFSTAVSLFCSVINMVLLMSTNKVAERFGGTGLMGGLK